MKSSCQIFSGLLKKSQWCRLSETHLFTKLIWQLKVFKIPEQKLSVLITAYQTESNLNFWFVTSVVWDEKSWNVRNI